MDLADTNDRTHPAGRGKDSSSLHISVVVPVYNAEKYVLETLTAIANQTYPYFEAIIVDDGSVDNSAELVQRFCQTDNRFRLIQKHNEGEGAARDTAIRQAHGEWIALCDADDVWVTEKLQKQVEFIVSNEHRLPEPLVAVGTAGYHINARGKVVGRFETILHTVDAFLEWRAAHRCMFMLNSSVLFRKTVYTSIGGYDRENKAAPDVDLWTRMSALGLLLNIPEVLTYYRVHGASLSDEFFIPQKVGIARIEENARRRAHREPEISHQDFLARLKQDPKAFRVFIRNCVASRYYRRAGVALVNGKRLTGMWCLLRAYALSPKTVHAKLGNQIFRKDVLTKLVKRMPLYHLDADNAPPSSQLAARNRERP